MVVEIDVPSNFCPECHGLLIELHAKGEIVCNKCGLVIKERDIDISRSGVRVFNYHEKARKWHNCNPISILVPDISLTTVLERNKIYNQDLRRAVRWDIYISWKSKNLLIAITELKRIASNLDLPERVQKAVVKLYKKALKKGLMRGRSIEGILTACLYLVCKKERIPITLQEMSIESSVNPRDLNKYYRVLIRELNGKPPNINPVLLIPKYISRLNLNIGIEKRAIGLIKDFIKGKFFSGKDPKGLCAGALYLISKLENRQITQKEISRVTGVTEVTLRSRYKELLKFLNKDPINPSQGINNRLNTFRSG